MARPRGIADEQLLAAARELLYGVGPAAFTLEKSASRAGVSATTAPSPGSREPGKNLAVNTVALSERGLVP
jgi:hypothetical protein